MDWEHFRAGVQDDFLLPLDSYTFQINFVEFEPSQNELLQLRKKLTAAAIDAVNATPDPSLYALKRAPSTDGALFHVHYGDPTFDFTLILNPDRLIMRKSKCSLEDLILSLPTFKKLAYDLFSTGGTAGQSSIADHPFFQNVFRTSHQFAQRAVLVPSGHESAQTNSELLGRAVRLDFFNASPDQIMRGRLLISLVEHLDGRPAEVWADIDAPWTVSKRDFELTFEMRRGSDVQGAELEHADLFEFEQVLDGFYKEVVLNRFFKKLFDQSGAIVQPHI